MEKKDIFKNTWVGPNSTTLDTLVEDWQNGTGGGGGGIPDVPGNEPSLRKKDAWVGGKNWLEEVVPEFPALKGPKGDTGEKGKDGDQGPPGKDGGIPEAPNDGNLYGRKNEQWSQVTGSGGIPEAPTDGYLYGRKIAQWVKVPDFTRFEDEIGIVQSTSPYAKYTLSINEVGTTYHNSQGKIHQFNGSLSADGLLISNGSISATNATLSERAEAKIVIAEDKIALQPGSGLDARLQITQSSNNYKISVVESIDTTIGSIDFKALKFYFNGKSFDPSSVVPQLQSDFNQEDNTKPDYVKNKPYIPPSGVYFGEIRFLPFRRGNLPEGWLVCDGYRYGITSQIGEKLNALSEEFMADWGMTVVDEKVNAPNLLTANRGYILRAVDGINEKVGTIEQIKSSAGDETIISNIGMIPAIYIN